MAKEKIKLLLEKFYSLKRKQQITLIIWSLHGLILFSLLIHHLSIRSFKPSRPIAVRTIISKPLAPPSEKKIQIAKSNPICTAAPKPSSQKKVESKTKSPANKSKNPIPSRPLSTTKNVVPQKTSIDEVTAALNILESLSPSTEAQNFALNVPTTIEEKVSPKSNSSQGTYNTYLISYLQECLDLPEFGAVKIELEINAEGKLLNLVILSSENTKNSEFLKNRLPRLAFPCFNDFNIHEKTLTLTISFRNAKTVY